MGGAGDYLPGPDVLGQSEQGLALALGGHHLAVQLEPGQEGGGFLDGVIPELGNVLVDGGAGDRLGAGGKVVHDGLLEALVLLLRLGHLLLAAGILLRQKFLLMGQDSQGLVLGGAELDRLAVQHGGDIGETLGLGDTGGLLLGSVAHSVTSFLALVATLKCWR